MSAAGSFYHCSVKTVSRSAGRSVVAAAAYRIGERLHDDFWDKTYDYSRRGGVMESFTLAPEDAPDWALVPESLWNAAEAAEKRINSTVGREVELALPAFLSPEAKRSICEEFAGNLVERYGVAVTVAIHSPGKGDERNYHAHILFTTRELDAEGFGKKTRILDDRKTGPEEVKKLRELAAEIINRSLIAANSDIRVDHRSFKERDIEREPTTHLGPGDAARERKGKRTEGGDHNRQAEEINGLIAERQELDKEIEKAKLEAQGVSRTEEQKQQARPELKPDEKHELGELIELAVEVAGEAVSIAETHREDGSTWERLGEQVEPFAKAVARSGIVRHFEGKDGLKWWQRLAVRAAQKALTAVRGLAQKAMTKWQPNPKALPPQRDAAAGIWQQRAANRSRESGRNEGRDR